MQNQQLSSKLSQRFINNNNNNKGDGDANFSWCTRNDPQGLSKGSRRAGNRRMSRDHPGGPSVKIKENENRDKYLDLSRALRKLWNISVTVIPKILGALGTIPKDLVKELEELEIGGEAETTQTTALLRSKTEKTSGDLLSLRLQ